jgi:hypothetical protein
MVHFKKGQNKYEVDRPIWKPLREARERVVLIGFAQEGAVVWMVPARKGSPSAILSITSTLASGMWSGTERS